MTAIVREHGRNWAQAANITGMTALCVSVCNRLLYPASYATRHTGEELIWAVYLVYAAAFGIGVAAFAFANKRNAGPDGPATGATVNAPAVLCTGIAGCLGVALPVAISPESGLGHAAVISGAVLTAAYICTHAAFWVQQPNTSSIRSAGLSLALALALVFLARGLMAYADVHGIGFVLACPLVSTACALFSQRVLPHSSETATAATDPAATEPLTQPVPADPHVSPAIASPAAHTSEAARPDMSTPAATDAPTVPVHVAHSSSAYPLTGSVPTAADAALAAIVTECDLSAREAEIAALAYRNYSAKRIGSELFIAQSTVYTHLKRIYRKVDVHSKQELIERIDSYAARQR